MKCKKLIFIILTAMFILLLSTTNSNASLYLNNLDFTVQINEDGSMDVIETWDIDISETNTLYKTFEIDKSKYRALTDISVKEITEGIDKEFNETGIWEYHIDKDYYFGGINTEGKYEIAWGVGLDDSSDTRTYLISYTVEDAIKRYGDCIELYWQFVGEEFEISANSITGIIKLPNEVNSKDELKVWGHTEYLNGEIYVTSNDTIEFNLNKYKSGNFVEVRIAIPNYVMENLAYTSVQNKLESIIEEETKWAEEANAKREQRDKIMKLVVCIISIVIVGIGIFLISKIKKYRKVLLENPKIKPEIELEYYRELPDETATPAEAYFVLNRVQDISKTLSATILNLTLKGYLKAEQLEKTVTFEIVKKDEMSLSEDEKQVLELLEKASKEEADKKIVKMKDLEKYIGKHPTSFENLKKKFEEISKDKAEQKGKFDKKIEEKSVKYGLKIVGYIIVLIIVFIATIMNVAYVAGIMNNLQKYIIAAGTFTGIITLINLVMCTKISSRFNGFIQKGVNEQEKWKAFKKYMEEFSLLNEKEVPHLVIWEKYLVYATAFGVAEKVIKQLKVKYPELNSEVNNDGINNLVLFSLMSGPNGLNTNFISSLNTSTSHMYSSTYSSGAGAGGGFSGGGGFRWPEEAAVEVAN